jgi:(hydroxyamino)benzene mutase
MPETIRRSNMGDVNFVLGKAGFILFTIGLVIGAFIPKFRNPRMGLSAHLTAVQAGTALVAFGLFWPFFNIAAWASSLLTISLVFSSVLLVVGLCLAAAFGASQSLPMAGNGFRARPTMESVVSMLTVGSSVWMLLACLAICLFDLLL